MIENSVHYYTTNINFFLKYEVTTFNRSPFLQYYNNTLMFLSSFGLLNFKCINGHDVNDLGCISSAVHWNAALTSSL